MYRTEEKRLKHNQYMKEFNKKNPEKRLASFNRWRKKRTIWLKDIKSKLSCILCGEKEVVCLDFHHKNPTEKNGIISRMLLDHVNKSLILKEMDKCIILCSNCHRKVTHKVIHL